jgi:cytochrome c-type biogenesis protein CcmF
VGGAFVVLLGTIYPVISEAIRGVNTSLGESFFNRVMGPIFLLLILVLGVCILLGWRRTMRRSLIRSALLPLVVALLLCLVLFLIGIREWYALILFPLCAFVASSHLATWYREVMARHRVRNENPLKAFAGSLLANRPHYGGMVVHLGIILVAIGIIGSSFYQAETDASLLPGNSMTIKGYTLTYVGMSSKESSTRTVVMTTLSVQKGDKVVATLRPKKVFHRSYEQPVTEVAIRSTPVEDLYVILAGWTEDGTAIFRVIVNPLVVWIWVGGGFLVAGGLIAFWPSRSRKR